MPPKIKVSKEDIVNTTLDIIRSHGEGAINARTIAARLGCSTQPIFSNFAKMEELKEATVIAAYELYESFISREIERGKYPPYKSFGMAYIRFAREEKELFKLLFMCDRGGKPIVPTHDFNASVEMIAQANGIKRELAELMHLEMWTFVHGICSMLVTSFLSFEDGQISQMMTDVYQGIRARHLSEESER